MCTHSWEQTQGCPCTWKEAGIPLEIPHPPCRCTLEPRFLNLCRPPLCHVGIVCSDLVEHTTVRCKPGMRPCALWWVVALGQSSCFIQTQNRPPILDAVQYRVGCLFSCSLDAVSRGNTVHAVHTVRAWVYPVFSGDFPPAYTKTENTPVAPCNPWHAVRARSAKRHSQRVGVKKTWT